MKETIAFIFARGGSKGVLRKNLRLLAGKPLIAHAIDVAHACASIDRVVVSSDDAEIVEVASKHGAETPFVRPPELAADDSPEWLAWQHAVASVSQSSGPFDRFVSLPPTAPLRAPEDVEACLAALDDTTDVVIGVSKAARNPYFNMVRRDAEGLTEILMKPENPITRRQDAPDVYDITTVAYASTPGFILGNTGLFEGRVKSVVVPVERALDIDSELDFRLAEFLMAEQSNA